MQEHIFHLTHYTKTNLCFWLKNLSNYFWWRTLLSFYINDKLQGMELPEKEAKEATTRKKSYKIKRPLQGMELKKKKHKKIKAYRKSL